MNADSHTTIRISLRWVALAAVLIFVIGVVGGLIGTNISRPSLPPLSNGSEQLVTTVQEVTISPSIAAAELVEQSQRAIVMLAEETRSGVAVGGLGTVLTNDGLVVSTENLSGTSLVAFDDTGRSIPLTRTGTDSLYGLTYYTLTESIAQPFEITGDDPLEGVQLLALNRSRTTFEPAVKSWRVSEYAVPTASQPIGRQRLALSHEGAPDVFDGSALLTDEGALAGIVTNASQGMAMPASAIRASLNRVTTGQREANPFTQWGFSISYGFELNADKTQYAFAATVASVAPRSPAAISTVRVGDVIVRINDEPVTWEADIASQLSTEEPLNVTILRDEQEQTFVLNPPTTRQAS